MIGLLIVVMIVVGVPLFAAVAWIALSAFFRAELEPALMIIGFMDLADQTQLLAVPLMCFAAAMLGRDYLQRWVLSISTLAPRGQENADPVSLALFPFSLIVAACGLALAMVVPALLFTVIMGVMAPRHGFDAGELIVAVLAPMAILMATVVCVPGLLDRVRAACEGMRGSAHSIGRFSRDLPVPLLLFVAVAAGWLTVMEVALALVVWVTVVRMLVDREVGWGHLPGMISRAVITSAGILLILGLAISWAAILHDTGRLQVFSEWFGPVSGSPVIFLVGLNLLLVAGGLVLGIQAGLVLLTPLTVPVALAAGIDPLHLGVVSIAALLLGRGLLPLARMLMPVGSPGRGPGSNEPVAATFRALSWPALLLLLVISGLPALSLWLPAAL